MQALLQSLTFAQPLLLLGLLALPALWWFLRTIPPQPEARVFPPLRILMQLRETRQTPRSSPWWLILLRLGALALLLLALSAPRLQPHTTVRTSQPLALIVDNDWSTAHDWNQRLDILRDITKEARRSDRPVAIIATAGSMGDIARARFLAAEQAERELQALQPVPWPTDRTGIIETLGNLLLKASPEIVWLGNGFGETEAQDTGFINRLKKISDKITYLNHPRPASAKLLLPPVENPERAGRTELHIKRARTGKAETVGVRLLSLDGRPLARQAGEFTPEADSLTVSFDLPTPIRNKGARFDLDSHASAATVQLLDEHWRRRPFGLLQESGDPDSQPLLSASHYLQKATAPFADLKSGNLADLLAEPMAVLLAPDHGPFDKEQREALQAWISKGGILLRFAGPRLATDPGALIPVPLRGSSRNLGGALTWSKPVPLAPFDANSPFFGLTVPADVSISRQVLAEPSVELNQKTWARLTDGTPLVTARREGTGWIILVHTSARASWSNLPLSGLFVEMLQRIARLSKGIAQGDPAVSAPPYLILDGFGQLGEPPISARPLNLRLLKTTAPGPEQPPGYYGNESSRRAFNLGERLTLPPVWLPEDADIPVLRHQQNRSFELLPPLGLLAFLLLLMDILATLYLRGLLFPAARHALPALLLALLLGGAGEVLAQDRDQQIIDSLEETRLAYVRTGDPQIDRMSESGLAGLSRILFLRTAVEPDHPVGLDLRQDELLVFPFIYWPISELQGRLDGETAGKLRDYLAGGGLILFDTRDAGLFLGDDRDWSSEKRQRLQMILRQLQVPRLTPVPDGHVLTRTFYLLNNFPGRYANGQVWVEEVASRNNDQVSSVIIGSNDWAAAWAMTETGQPLARLNPGGNRQREMAFRFGVNVVLYTLTGNYKADQVHVPAILERLGQ